MYRPQHDPSWPRDEDWGPWQLASPKDPWEIRKHEELVLFERRCRHCKDLLEGIPPANCLKEECQALNVVSGFEPTSFRQVAYQNILNGTSHKGYQFIPDPKRHDERAYQVGVW